MTIPQPGSSPESHFKFSTVPGYFLQDEPTTDPDTFDYVSLLIKPLDQFSFITQTSNFGLISRPYDSDATFDSDQQKTQWQRLGHQIESLNARSPSEVNYKLLYLGRHGEGYHNVAERQYGTAAWDVCLLPFKLRYSSI